MTIALTVAICAHNPRQNILEETLRALQGQLPLDDGAAWELLLVDNASHQPLVEAVDLSWHPASRIVREDRLGLTHARLRCLCEARGDVIVFVDDDNLLGPTYLRTALSVMEDDPTLGAVGGKSIPRYEAEPPSWFDGLGIDLACRDLGDAPLHASWSGLDRRERTYPTCAPIGAGLVIRTRAYAACVEAIAGDPTRIGLGRKGADLSSGEDNDMVMTLLDLGWRVGYVPELILEHQIPRVRLQPDYLARYAFASNRTWVQVLAVHGIRPWSAIAPWTAPLRKFRAMLRDRPWRSPADHIRWRGACGLIDGRVRIGASAAR